MSCLKCGGPSEEGALLCDGCAEACYAEPKFFLSPVLVGRSVFSRMRAEGSAVMLLGPVSGNEISRIPSIDVERVVKDLPIQGLQPDELKSVYEKCNSILAHLGAPFNLDQPAILLTEDAAETITQVVAKVDAFEKAFPLQAMSDLYIRVGVVYWSASRGVLLRVASNKWKEEKGKLLTSKAREYFSKVCPKDDLHSIALRNLGLLALESKEWAEAERNLSNALKHFPSDPRIAEALATANLEMGNQMEALTRVDDSLAQGETPRLWVLKGKIMRGMGRSQEALECFNRALTMDPKFMDAHDLVIGILRDLGRFDESALAEQQRLLSRTPDLERKVAELVSEFKESVPKVQDVPKPKPPESAPRPEPPPKAPRVTADIIALARKAMESKDYDSAIQYAEDLLRDKPQDRAAQLILIESLVGVGDTMAASAKAHAFYEHNRNDPVAWYWRGVISDKEGKWGAAVQYLSKAVTLDPRMIDAWLVMGDTLLRNEKHSGADESYSRALQIDPDSPKGWLGKGRAMRAMGRWGAAIQCLDKYNMLIPGDKDAWLLKADILFEKEKYRRAVEAYDKYIQLSEDDSYALCKKGISLNAVGMTDEARVCFEESVRLDPGNKDAAHWLKTIKSGGGA